MKISNWGNYPVVDARVLPINYPSDIKTALKQEGECISRGLGRCYGDSALSATIWDNQHSNRVISFDAKTGLICAQSGLSIAELLNFVVPKGWFIPVTPGTK